jgi:conjugal transfer ATP-binding protein TraC
MESESTGRSLDPLESLWPDGAEVRSGEMLLGDTWIRTLAPRGWPHEVHPGWIEPLVQFPYPNLLSVVFEPVPVETEVRQLTRRLVWTHGAREAAQRQGRLPDPRETAALDDAERLRQDLARGDTRLLRTGLAMSLMAPTLADLEERTTLLESLAQGLMMPLRRLKFRQAETWVGRSLGQTLPPGAREMDSRAAATFFPLIGDDIQHETGEVWGENPRTRLPIVIDRRRLPAPHSLTVGWSGSGKSFAAKLLVLRARYHGIPVLVIDPEGEYRGLAARDGLIRVGETRGLNPLAMGEGPLELQRRAEFALRWIQVLAGTLGSRTLRVLEQSLRESGHLTPKDWLRDVAHRDERAAARIEGAILRWSETMGGGDGRLPDQGLTVIDLSGVPPALKVATYLVAVEHVLTTLPARHQRWVLFDEAWHLLGHPLLAPYLEELYRRARKWRTAVSLVTQDAQDTLRSPAAQICLRNSPLVLLLRPHADAVPELRTIFQLSQAEAEVLASAGVGDGLLLVDRLRLPIRVRASRLEQELIVGRSNTHGDPI